MADAKTRAQNVLRALPLSRKQRELYERGVAAMDEATLERTTSKLESALSRVPAALAAARELLANQQPQSRKRAVIFVEDEEYRHDLTGMLGEKLEIETAHAPEEAIQMISRTFPDIVICDLMMPSMRGLDVVRRIRRAASSPRTIFFVLTTNPEEDGQVAAAGAIGYRVSKTATDLTRAVTSAIEARARLSEKV
jgi:CheY-like chemotaxis protein